MEKMKKKHIITLGGLPGSGKSTVKRLLAEKLGYQMFSTGDFVRDMAAERNMTLEEFNELVIHDKTIDELIDARLKEIEATGDNYIIDSHLAYHFVPSGFSVFLSIDPKIAAHRILSDAQSPTRKKSGDIMHTYEEALERTKRRVQNHLVRYLKHYGINPYKEKQYHCVIETASRTPEEVAAHIEEAYNAWLTT